MWRNPFAAVVAAVKSLLPKRGPVRRTVTLAMPSEAKEHAPSPARQHTKHGHRSLSWRRWNRPRRRAALAMRWTSVMAHVNHRVATMWRGFWAKRAPEIAGQSPRLSKGLPGWKSFKKRARREAVSL